VDTRVDTRALRRQAMAARILEAAWALARQDGVAAISLRDLAQMVGMRAPSLYTYFPSKHALYDAMFADAARQLTATVARRRMGATPGESLRNRARCFIDFCTTDSTRYQLLFQRPIPDFEPTPASLAITLGVLAGTRADLEAAGIHGEQAVDMYRAVISGLVTQQVSNEPGGDRWTRLLDEAVDMFLAHYARQAPDAGQE
jgi:AcrR family transcriptional regulator